MYGARIRYVKVNETELKSLRSYEGMVVHLFPEENVFTLVKESDLVFQGRVNGGLHKLKMAAKSQLENKGVVFNTEQRKKRTPVPVT